MPNDKADMFRRGDCFKTTRNGKTAYGYVYEYNKVILAFGDSAQGVRITRDEVPADATPIYAGEIAQLPKEMSLVFKTAALVADN